MDIDDLMSLDQAERDVVRALRSDLRAVGRLEDPKHFFPEADPAKSRGYGRGSVPLPLLALLYDEVVVYVPPLPLAHVESRVGMAWEDLLTLTDAGLIRPVVGHLSDYTGAHFDELLRRRPHSIWARGLALIEVLDMEDTLEEAACPLPVAEMASDPRLRADYVKRFPKYTKERLDQRIRQEILTEYADISVVGLRDLAAQWVELRDPSLILSRLLFTAESTAYPLLFGGGGTANYDLRRLHDLGWVDARLAEALRAEAARVLPMPELERLFAGIDLRVGTLTAEEIRHLHVDGTVTLLRRSLAEFESAAAHMVKLEEAVRPDAVPEVEAHAAILTENLNAAAVELGSLERSKEMLKRHRRAANVFKAGGMALGAVGAAVATHSPLAAISTPALIGLLTDPIVDKAATAFTVRNFQPGLGALWEARIRKDERGR